MSINDKKQSSWHAFSWNTLFSVSIYGYIRFLTMLEQLHMIVLESGLFLV